jgi:hypothetical protein
VNLIVTAASQSLDQFRDGAFRPVLTVNEWRDNRDTHVTKLAEFQFVLLLKGTTSLQTFFDCITWKHSQAWAPANRDSHWNISRRSKMGGLLDYEIPSRQVARPINQNDEKAFGKNNHPLVAGKFPRYLKE